MKTETETETEEFIYHASRAFFGSAWADQCEECEQSSMLSGREILSIMPHQVDPAAIHAAKTLLMDVERINEKSIEQLMGMIERDGDGDRPNTAEFFGHYAAMQSMGHGVGLYDAFGSGIAHEIKIPYVEFGSHSLEKDYFEVQA